MMYLRQNLNIHLVLIVKDSICPICSLLYVISSKAVPDAEVTDSAVQKLLRLYKRFTRFGKPNIVYRGLCQRASIMINNGGPILASFMLPSGKVQNRA